MSALGLHGMATVEGNHRWKCSDWGLACCWLITLAVLSTQQRVQLALRDDAISPGVDGCVVGHLKLLHDYAENRACELINQVLAAGET